MLLVLMSNEFIRILNKFIDISKISVSVSNTVKVDSYNPYKEKNLGSSINLKHAKRFLRPKCLRTAGKHGRDGHQVQGSGYSGRLHRGRQSDGIWGRGLWGELMYLQHFFLTPKQVTANQSSIILLGGSNIVFLYLVVY